MLPDKNGHFKIDSKHFFGGKFVPETLMTALQELEKRYEQAKGDNEFQKELKFYLTSYAGRPTSLYFAEQLTKKLGNSTRQQTFCSIGDSISRKGAKIYLKREDLCHTGAHKINNTLGQVLLAKKMGKTRVIAETGAGQHGVATATAAAMFGLECEVYMGTEDIERQALNVFRMNLLGAKVIPVSSGSKTLKDAINEAIRDWVTNVENTHYVIGSVVGPHPYPMMVRDFQSVIGLEVREQILSLEGKLPDYLVACVGGGSNSMGLFYPFYDDDVAFIGVEAAGKGLETGLHSASLEQGSLGVLHGSLSYVIQDLDGQIMPTHSVSAGLDYPGVGPEHSYYKDSNRARYVSVTDEEALDSFQLLAQIEGIIPALESAHAIAYAIKLATELDNDKIIIINLSGRGDKDVETVAEILKGSVR